MRCTAGRSARPRGACERSRPTSSRPSSRTPTRARRRARSSLHRPTRALSAICQASRRRLLATERGKLAVQRFFESYLGYTRATSIERPSATDYAARAPDMVQETRAFIEGVVLQGGGGVRELLTSPSAYPSRALAPFYGADFPVPATDYAPVTRPANRGIGILAQGSFLAIARERGGVVADPARPVRVPAAAMPRKARVPDNVPEISQPEPGVRRRASATKRSTPRRAVRAPAAIRSSIPSASASSTSTRSDDSAPTKLASRSTRAAR